MLDTTHTTLQKSRMSFRVIVAALRGVHYSLSTATLGCMNTQTPLILSTEIRLISRLLLVYSMAVLTGV
jgi:hypothetical protein